MEVKVVSAVPMGTEVEKREMCQVANRRSQWMKPEVILFHLQNK